MTAKVTWGHGILNAMNGPPPSGRICFLPNVWFTADKTYAYPGFDQTANTIAANTDMLAAMMLWLTGKTTGASVLIVAIDPVSSGGYFGTVWQAALAGLGHSTTLTGAASSFNGYDPLNFDCVCTTDTYNPPDVFGVAFDAYIDARGAAITFNLPGNHVNTRYGVQPRPSSPYYQTYVSAPDYLMTYPVLPFDSSSHQIIHWWAIQSQLYAGSRGGTMTLHNNSYGEPGIATWVADA